MKIILTGSNGNLGREIISQNNIYKILPIHRDNWEDIANLSLGSDDIVIHAASDLLSNVHENPAALIDSNVASTARLLEIARGCARFIYISSCAVYGHALKSAENTVCQPISINGITKLLNERIVEEFCSKNEIPYLILRVFNTYGGRDHFSIISKLLKSLKTGIPFQLCNHGIAQRDFIHVSDVASIVLKLSRLDLPSGYLNIGTGCATKISDVVDFVKKIYPDLKIINKAASEVEYSRADIAKLSELLSYKFINIHDELPSLINSNL